MGMPHGSVVGLLPDFVSVSGLNSVAFSHDGTHIFRTDSELMASQIQLVAISEASLFPINC